MTMPRLLGGSGSTTKGGMEGTGDAAAGNIDARESSFERVPDRALRVKLGPPTCALANPTGRVHVFLK